MIGIDPGRSNIIYATDGVRKMKLSRKQYYCESGIFEANRDSVRWNMESQAEIASLSKDSSKTCSLKKRYVMLKHFLQSSITCGPTIPTRDGTGRGFGLGRFHVLIDSFAVLAL